MDRTPKAKQPITNADVTPTQKRVARQLFPAPQPSKSSTSTTGTATSLNRNAEDAGKPQVNLLDILTLPLPETPEAYSFAQDEKISTTTRTPCDKDYELKEDQQLKYIIPFGPMLHPLIENVKHLLSNCFFDHDDPWLAKLHPEARLFHHPCYICSEHDTEDFGWAAHFRPAFAVVHKYTDAWDKDPRFPNAFSCGGSPPVPDGMVFRNGLKDPVATIEFKRHVVMQHEAEDELSELLVNWLNMPLGKAVKFNWPYRGESLAKSTKILTQIWSQMVHKDVRFAVLSSYDTTYFFHRHDDNTMYMSDPFTWDDRHTTVAMLAFLGLALGRFVNTDLFYKNLPLPICDWWNAAYDRDAPGIDQRTLPANYYGETVRRERHLSWVETARLELTKKL